MMKKTAALILVLCLIMTLAACGGPSDGNLPVGQAPTAEPAPEPTPEPTPEPAPKTSLTVAELADGTYTGTLSGGDTVNGEETIFTTIMPAQVTLTIANGQVTYYSESATTSYGVLGGVQTPQSPDTSMILSGSLPLQQSGDLVTAEGEVTSSGKSVRLNYTDGKFDSWELIERSGSGRYACTVSISMTDGAPLAAVAVDIKGQLSLTATVPLALKGEGGGELLSAPYVEMLRSGDYQYTYSLEYEGVAFKATIACYNGMLCRKVVSDDGSFSQRVLTIDGHAWRVDDLTGAVVDGGTENAETQPDYSFLTFAGTGALETGAIGDAYDFEFEGQKCNMVFLFTPEGQLVALVVTIDGETSSMEILSFDRGGGDPALFDVPSQG